MKLTVGELIKKLQQLPSTALVCIERIEDVYFEKHGWKTETIEFGNSYENEANDVFVASQACVKDDKLIILGHY